MEKQGRLQYIDAVRGLTMSLVVLQHVNTCWGEWNAVTNSVLDQALMTFRMPLFFFVSGFLAYKASEHWSLPYFKRRILTKARVQLVPTFVFFILFALCFDKAPLGFLHKGFGFFWFTPALFEMFCIYFPICYFLRNRPKVQDKVFIVIALAGAQPILKLLEIPVETHPIIDRTLNIHNVLYYFEFFILGHFVHKYYKSALAILKNDYLNFAAIAIFVISMLAVMQTKLYTGGGGLAG